MICLRRNGTGNRLNDIPGRYFQSSEGTPGIDGINRNALVLQNLFKGLYNPKVQLLGRHRIQLACNIENLSKTILCANDLLFQISFFPINILVDFSGKNQFIFQKPVLLADEPDGIVLVKFRVAAHRSHQKEKHEGQPVCGLIEDGHRIHSGRNLRHKPGHTAQSRSSQTKTQAMDGCHNDNICHSEIHNGKNNRRIRQAHQYFHEEEQHHKLCNLYQQAVVLSPPFDSLPGGQILFLLGCKVFFIFFRQILQKGNSREPAVLFTDNLVGGFQSANLLTSGKCKLCIGAERPQRFGQVGHCDSEVVAYRQNTCLMFPVVQHTGNQHRQVGKGDKMHLCVGANVHGNRFMGMALIKNSVEEIVLVAAGIQIGNLHNTDIQKRCSGIELAEIFLRLAEDRSVCLGGKRRIQGRQKQDPHFLTGGFCIFQNLSEFFRVILLGVPVGKVSGKIYYHIKIIGLKNRLYRGTADAEQLDLICRAKLCIANHSNLALRKRSIHKVFCQILRIANAKHMPRRKICIGRNNNTIFVEHLPQGNQCAVIQDMDQALNQDFIKHTAHTAGDHLDRNILGKGFFITALTGQGIIGICQCHHLGTQRNFFSLKPFRIACPVIALMMIQRNVNRVLFNFRRHGFKCAVFQEPGTQNGVLLYNIELHRRKLSGKFQNTPGNLRFANIMHRRRHRNILNLLIRQGIPLRLS